MKVKVVCRGCNKKDHITNISHKVAKRYKRGFKANTSFFFCLDCHDKVHDFTTEDRIKRGKTLKVKHVKVSCD